MKMKQTESKFTLALEWLALVERAAERCDEAVVRFERFVADAPGGESGPTS